MLYRDSTVLGPILAPDLVQIFAWHDDPANARFNETYIPKSFEREGQFWLNSAGDSSRVFFAIRARGAADIIGHLQISNIHPVHRSATLGIMIGNMEDRGKGHGLQAMKLGIDYCWRHLNLTRLALNVHSDNAAAISLYQRLGFVTEGVLRQVQFIDGKWIDLTLMALMQVVR